MPATPLAVLTGSRLRNRMSRGFAGLGARLCLLLLLLLAVSFGETAEAARICLGADDAPMAAEAAPIRAHAGLDRHGKAHSCPPTCCLHGVGAGLLSIEPKVASLARLPVSYPPRPAVTPASRALVPEPAPPRALRA